jgi:two-component system, cell cycle sensor histidine kinase and response regulator CckA
MPRPKILVVEDDPFSVQLLRHNLKKYEAELLPVATTVPDALRIASEHHPDVALIDIYIAGEKEGIAIAEAIQQQLDIPIIFLTGYSSDEVFELAKGRDPFGYILKPYTSKELTVALDMALYKHKVGRQLRQSRQLLDSTLKALHEAVIATDVEWRVSYANSVAEQWLGLTSGTELLPLLKLSAASGSGEIVFDPSLFASAQAPVCRLQLSDRFAYVKISVRPQAGEADGYVVAISDISAQYEKQKDAHTVLSAMESLEEGLIILHPATEKVIYASKGFERICGWRAGDVVGEVPFFLFGAQAATAFWHKARAQVESAGYFKGESVVCTKAGVERLMQWQISRVASTEGSPAGEIIVFLRDISEQRQMEEELRQSQKIEAVGRLAGGVAHDFNNMLSVINSYADLLTLKLPPEDPLLKYVANIRAAGDRAGELVGKLLTFSRRDSAKPALLNVQQITEEMQKMLRRVIRENIHIKLEYRDQLPGLWADQLQIEQIIMNLCVNARDAIAEGGNIKIAWDSIQLSAVDASAKQLTAGRYLCLSVSDSGCGMSPEVLSRIFEPYFTTKASGKGTGLGLSIVYGIARQLKGTVEVESAVGKGTTFRIYMPASDSAAAAASKNVAVAEPAPGHEHILVVEDEENFAECLQSLLSLHGYKVLHARDAKSAEELFRQSLHPIKLLISDMVLPGISGQELAKRLKSEDDGLKVIFITGYENAVNSLQDFPYTALVLQKPFSVVSILNKVREVLDSPQGDKKIQIL